MHLDHLVKVFEFLGDLRNKQPVNTFAIFERPLKLSQLANAIFTAHACSGRIIILLRLEESSCVYNAFFLFFLLWR